MLTNSNFYIGDSSVSRLYQGDDLIWDSNHPDILLSYLQAGETPSSGVSRAAVYFNTGYYPDSSTDIEISYQNTIYGSLGSSYSYMLIGCSQTTGGGYSFSGDHYIASPGAGKKWRYRNNSNVLAPDSSVDLNKHIIRTVNNGTSQTIYYDGVATTGSSSGMKTFELPLYLFCFNTNGNPDSYALKGTRIYYVKIWEDNNLIRFYIPVLHYTNGKYTPCFYDKVNDTYIYNLGTDTPTYKIQGDYLLDYLGSTPETAIPNNAQIDMRYDSGVVASNQLQIDMKGRIVWGKENYLFGSATSGQTTPTWQAYGYGTTGGSTDADKMRLRMGFGSSSTSNYTMYLTSDASTVVNVNTVSIYCDTTSTSTRGYCYLNGTLSNTSSPAPSVFSSNSIHLFSRHGDASKINASGGSRIYYINFTTSNVPTKTYIPVFHNNQVAFLDLNSGTYIYNIGTAAPYGELLIPKDPADIQLRGIAARSTCGTTGVNDVYFPLNMQYVTSADTEYIVDFQLDESALTTSYTHSNYIITSTNDSKMFNLGFSGNHQLQFTLGDWDGDDEDYATYTGTLQAGTQYRADANLQYTSPSTGYYAAKLRVYDSSWSSYIVGSGGVPNTDFNAASLNLFSSSTGAGYLHYGGIYVSRIHFLDDGDEYNDYQAVLHWNGTAYVPCFKDVKYNTYVYNAGTGTPVYLL